ncbi:hypothetical protein IMG5_142280 [Ichthyophthirius multifiliis]|uniref:Uncharacterized protein n=1 Tax=Ichthyophthirius multifiliis TaxID=5932 RepID=G0QXF3_ICHMU|nr:hypothetical protein IMG5_142280 [Ichthyophthirius multifiliis]EGR30102.1 hypothetical protein IMG5_142280 [Ichthyophthirius multifiliis]|eukprot:XP_004031338.1 hypothetical protein IMG5_142280 [Ichthyophthirius multifiliis]
MESCIPQNFQVEGTQDYFLKQDYKNMYCISIDQTGISLEGEFSADIYKNIEIQLHKCEQGGDRECLKSEEVEEKLENFAVTMQISDTTVDITNKKSPFKNIGKNLFWKSGPSFYKFVNIYLRNNYIQSDYGYLGSDIITERAVSYSQDREQVLQKTSSMLFNFNIAYEKNKESIYTRTYLKIDTALAQIGGMFNLMVTIGCAICWPISELELNRKLVQPEISRIILRKLF